MKAKYVQRIYITVYLALKFHVFGVQQIMHEILSRDFDDDFDALDFHKMILFCFPTNIYLFKGNERNTRKSL